MKVFITGATGLVGAHTAMALMDAGHSVRLLVRNKALAQQYFTAKGYKVDDFVVADMREKDIIKPAMQTCDGVVHAAAMVSLDPTKAQEIYDSNIASIDAVIGSAIECGIKNIIYVSSMGALFNPANTIVNEDTPLGISKEAYLRSKRDCDEHVRRYQEHGAPVQITYPSGIFGPDDPKLNESNHGLITLFKTIMPLTSSGLQFIDCRDLARAHVYLLEHTPMDNFTQGRYLVAGNYYSWEEFHQLFERITGKRKLTIRIPGAVLRFFGFLMDLVQKIIPIEFPVTSESMALITQWTVADSGKILKTANMQFRSGEETMSDTARWLVKAGHLPAKYIGKLAQ